MSTKNATRQRVKRLSKKKRARRRKARHIGWRLRSEIACFTAVFPGLLP